MTVTFTSLSQGYLCCWMGKSHFSAVFRPPSLPWLAPPPSLHHPDPTTLAGHTGATAGTSQSTLHKPNAPKQMLTPKPRWRLSPPYRFPLQYGQWRAFLSALVLHFHAYIFLSFVQMVAWLGQSNMCSSSV